MLHLVVDFAMANSLTNERADTDTDTGIGTHIQTQRQLGHVTLTIRTVRSAHNCRACRINSLARQPAAAMALQT